MGTVSTGDDDDEGGDGQWGWSHNSGTVLYGTNRHSTGVKIASLTLCVFYDNKKRLHH